MTDHLTLARAFEGASLKTDDAEQIAPEIYDAIHGNIATKTDLRELEQRFELRFENLERPIERMVIRQGARAVVIAEPALAALQYWPPR
ncbi:MAG: hypothetical protein WA417_10540 [Stellaceae bacterium]|jgi:hypothetical protein